MKPKETYIKELMKKYSLADFFNVIDDYEIFDSEEDELAQLTAVVHRIFDENRFMDEKIVNLSSVVSDEPAEETLTLMKALADLSPIAREHFYTLSNKYTFLFNDMLEKSCDAAIDLFAEEGRPEKIFSCAARQARILGVGTDALGHCYLYGIGTEKDSVQALFNFYHVPNDAYDEFTPEDNVDSLLDVTLSPSDEFAQLLLENLLAAIEQNPQLLTQGIFCYCFARLLLDLQGEKADKAQLKALLTTALEQCSGRTESLYYSRGMVQRLLAAL